MTGYPYDPEHLHRVATLLRTHLPAMHRQSRDADDLLAVLETLGAPLAAVRQSIEELHADFFVDTAGDSMLSTLARSIGLTLAFRDPEANRRDLRAAMARRRRKGVPGLLRDIAHELLDRPSTMREGWKTVMIAQDVNLPRAERMVVDLRDVSTAARVGGPLGSVARLGDPRPVGSRTGHDFPDRIVHWAFLNRLYPLHGAACHEMTGGPPQRYAFEPDDIQRMLRARPGHGDAPGVDHAPEALFARAPERWFGREGGFAVRIAGLPAATAPRPAPRIATDGSADMALVRGAVRIEAVLVDPEPYTASVTFSVHSVDHDDWKPDDPPDDPPKHAMLNIERGSWRGATLTGKPGTDGAEATARRVLLRVGETVSEDSTVPEDNKPPTRSFRIGETVLAIAGGEADARRISTRDWLVRSGYLRGALFVRVPQRVIDGVAWFEIAADGSLREIDGSGARQEPPVAEPIGPVWPVAPESADRDPLSPALIAPGTPPVPAHGLQAVAEAGARHALVFGLAFEREPDSPVAPTVEPMARLDWEGADPAEAEWTPLSEAAFRALAGKVANAGELPPLTIRFESTVAGAILTPGEIAFTAFDGRATLIHLPEMEATDLTTPDWIPLAGMNARSVRVEIGADGAAWSPDFVDVLRNSLGQAIPVREAVQMRRRRVAWRRLCAWKNELETGLTHAPTGPGRLDVDPRFGLFEIAADEPPQGYPDRAAGGSVECPVVTVDRQVGATMAIGSIPVDRDRRLGRGRSLATRLVSKSGALGAGATLKDAALPVHTTLSEALRAATGKRETIRIVDSARYDDEALVWPTTPKTLAIEAAPGTRPLVEVVSSTVPAAGYKALELCGLTLTGALALPGAEEISLFFLSASEALTIAGDSSTRMLKVERTVLAGLRIEGIWRITVTDAIIDAGASDKQALDAPDARLKMDRATVIGSSTLRQVDISDSILLGPVTATERFHGCVRYSLLAQGGSTPRKHRVLDASRAPLISRDRGDPAYMRLDQRGNPAILSGASDGGEIGAFNRAKLTELLAGARRRLEEHTPAGLATGLILVD